LEERHWVAQERFVESLSPVSMTPGATATPLAIFLGDDRGGSWVGCSRGRAA
jgi:chromate transport protein ChrA